MCRINKDGNLVLKNGKIVKSIEDLDQKEINELFDENLSRYEGLAILNHLEATRANMHGLRKDVQGIENAVTNAVGEMKNHTAGCPVNPEAIEKIVDARNNKMLESLRDEKTEAGKRFNMRIDGRIKHVITTSILNTANIAKALGVIVGVFVGVGAVAYGIYSWII